MSHWKIHRHRILEEISMWANHKKLKDSASRTAIVSALHDAELNINEASKAEEEKEYMNGD